MDMNKPEVAAVAAVAAGVGETLLVLNDLELAMVGGGVGEVILG